MSETIWVEKLVQGEDNNWKWEPTPISVNTEGDFSIDELNLNQEICRMGQVMLKYGDLTAELQSELKRKEENLKLLSASLAAAHRSNAELNGTKLTENKLNELVTSDHQYQAALQPLHLLRASAVKAEHWWRTANVKAKMIEALAFRQSAEIRRGNH